MYKLLSIILTVMTALGGWFGFADRISINPARLTFESENLVSDATVTVSKNNAFKSFLTDASSITYWMTGKENGEYIEVDFGEETAFNTVVLRENTDNAEVFTIYAYIDGEYEEIYRQDRIMTYRMCTFNEVTASKIKIEFTEMRDSMSIGGIEVYNEDRTDTPLRTSAYLSCTSYVDSFIDAPGFADYFDVVTDLIVFSNVHLDKEGNIYFNEGEEKFAQQLAKIREAIGDRDVNIWCTILFQLSSGDPNVDDNDYRADFITSKFDTIMANIKAFTEKYDIYGIDYDWEHPTKTSQFKVYDKLIIATAEFAKVSVASVTWEFRFSDETVEAIDHFNVMTYDLFDERGNHSNIYDCGRLAIEKMIGFGVPKEKIFLGIPTYGRPDNGGAYWPSFASYPQLGEYGNYVPDLSFTIGGETYTSGVYFNSRADVRDKAALSQQFGTGGVMIYNLNSDVPFQSETSLMAAIYETQTVK